MRRIWLCADDYGIAPGVDTAIRDLVTRGRLNATSVMVVTPSFSRAEANALSVLNTDKHRVAIGLHLALTGPLKPLTPRYTPLADGAFFPVATTLRLAIQQRLDMTALAGEFRARAAKLGIATNPAFAGTYTFRPNADFAALFPAFLEGLPEGGLVMCHPGHVDAELERLDPLTILREREYDYFCSDAFPAALKTHELSLN